MRLAETKLVIFFVILLLAVIFLLGLDVLKSNTQVDRVYIFLLITIVLITGIIVARITLITKGKAEKKIADSEKRLHTFIKRGPDAVIVINEKQQIQEWNPKAEEIFGYKAGEVMGQPLSETIIPHQYREAHKKGMAHFLKTGEGPVLNKTIEITALHRNGHEFFVNLSISNVKLEGEWLFIAFLSDITERKKAEKQIIELNKELESFTYSVSHDLRAPLRIIHSYAELINGKYSHGLDEEANKMLGKIMINATRLGNLIDDLLNFSRLGRKELITHPTDMNHLVHPIVEQQLDGKTNYTVKIHPLPQCYCDSSLIKQVWENLISNAIKYSSTKANPSIEIGSMEGETGTVFYVKDNGVGFDMKYYDNLFGVFQRLHTNDQFEGTGAGLALSKRIISKHGGNIWAESGINEGATFYFTFCKA